MHLGITQPGCDQLRSEFMDGIGEIVDDVCSVSQLFWLGLMCLVSLAPGRRLTLVHADAHISNVSCRLQLCRHITHCALRVQGLTLAATPRSTVGCAEKSTCCSVLPGPTHALMGLLQHSQNELLCRLWLSWRVTCDTVSPVFPSEHEATSGVSLFLEVSYLWKAVLNTSTFKII